MTSLLFYQTIFSMGLIAPLTMIMTAAERKEYNKKYRLEHKEQIQATNQRYQEKNRNKINAYKRKWVSEPFRDIMSQEVSRKEEEKPIKISHIHLKPIIIKI